MKVQKPEIGTGVPFLSPKNAKDRKITIVKILDEFKPVTSEYEGKTQTRLTGTCSTQVDDPKKIKWAMNPTTERWMIDTHGDETLKWINLEIPIQVKQAGSASPAIYPKECSLEKVIA